MTKATIHARITERKKFENAKFIRPGSVLVGIPSDAAPYPDGTRVVDVAVSHEFGIGVPERSFLRSTVSENRKKYVKMLSNGLAKVRQGKLTVDQMLKVIGIEASVDVKQKITDIDTPPNSQKTEDRKGFNNPLIETGHMQRQVTYEVKK